MDEVRRVLVVSKTGITDGIRAFIGADSTVEVVSSFDEALDRLSKRSYDRIIIDPDSDFPARILMAEQRLKQLQAVVDNSPSVIYIKDLSGRILIANKALSELLQIPKEELIGKTFYDIYPKEAAEQYAANDKQVIESVSAIEIEESFPQDGRTRIFLSQKFPLVDEEGEIYAIACISTDITARKEAEAALKESEEIYSKAFQSSPQVMIITRAEDGQYIDVNEAFTEVFGYTKEEAIGRTSTELDIWYKPEDRNVMIRALQDLTRIKSMEFRFRTKSGKTLTALFSAEPVEMHGKIRLLSTMIDISDRKRMEEELRRNEENFREAFAFAPIGMVLADLKGRFIHVNAAFSRITGYSYDELVNSNLTFQSLTYDDDQPSNREAFYDLLEGKKPALFIERRYLRKDGKVIWVQISTSLRRDINGRPFQIVGLIEDITDRKQTEQQREQLLDRERRIADTLQKALIPKNTPKLECCNAAVIYEPAFGEAEVGGDFYDIFDLGDNKIGILIGDVAGKGLNAAIRVAAVRHSIRSYAYLDPRPSKVMSLANNALSRDENGEIELLTAFFAVVDTEVGLISYANGGHETTLLKTSTGTIEELVVSGRALGVLPGYDYPERSRRLQKGDTIIMITDGITEARPDSNDLFGIERVHSHLETVPAELPIEEIAKGLLEAARAHANGHLRDDAAIVVFRWERQ